MILPTALAETLTLALRTFTIMMPVEEPRKTLVPAESEAIEFGRYGSPMAVPTVFVAEAMGIRVSDLVLAA